MLLHLGRIVWSVVASSALLNLNILAASCRSSTTHLLLNAPALADYVYNSVPWLVLNKSCVSIKVFGMQPNPWPLSLLDPCRLSFVQSPVSLNLMQWPSLILCSATTDLSGSYRRKYRARSMHLIWMVRSVYPMFFLLNLQMIQYRPGNLRASNSLLIRAGANFSAAMCTLLVLILPSSLLFLSFNIHLQI